MRSVSRIKGNYSGALLLFFGEMILTLKEKKTGGVLTYMGYIGMCRCEGYGFQAVYSRIGK